MLLIYPPLTKACEPPAGVSQLSSFLNSYSFKNQVVDFNFESQERLLNNYFKKYPKKEHYRNQIRDIHTYSNYDKYLKSVSELNKGLNSIENDMEIISLSNYNYKGLDPLNSLDLLKAVNLFKDSIFYDFYTSRLMELKGEFDFKHVGISIQFINQAIPSFFLIGVIKDLFPNIKIVLGGGLVTSWVKSNMWNDQFSSLVDCVISGPGEEKLAEYLGIDLNKEPIVKCGKNLLPPDYRYTNNYNYYAPKKIIPLSASLGCSWKRCTFCPEKAENSQFIPKNRDDLLREIELQKRLYKPGLIHFLDNELTPVILKLLSENQVGVPWYGFTKFYDLLKDIDFCKKLRDSGCKMLKLGLESGDQSVLDAMNKGINLESVKIIFKNLRDSGIKTFVYILFGTPAEDIAAARKTASFIEEYSSCITYLNIAIFNMPINSQLYKESDTFKLSESDLALYSGFNHPKGWDRRKIRQFISNDLKKRECIRKIIQRTPTLFNANHCPFF